MSEFIIVTPTDEEIPTVGKVANPYSDELGWVSHGELRSGLEIDSLRVCKEVSTGKIVGYILWRTRKRDGITRIYSVAVSPEYTRKGLGRLLISNIPEPTILSCPESAVAAQQFYQSLGFHLNQIKEGRKQKLYEFTKGIVHDEN